MNSDALRLDNVTCAFPARNGGTYTAVADANVSVADGEFVSIVGPTGCGKSTLLNAAAGLLRPTAGTVRIFGQPLNERNELAGYLFQSDALFPWRTARENVMVGLEIRGERGREARARADQWLKRVHLAGHADKYPHELSGGMRKRVALAQTFVVDPKILLMDEPFSALDVQTRTLMENELLGLWSQTGKTVVFVTHDIEEAISLSDRVVVMSSGPASRPIGDFAIDLVRPRDVLDVRLTPRFLDIHREIWETLKTEVLKTYGQDAA